MFTKEIKPTRVYKVVVENMITGDFETFLVEATNTHEASDGIINKLGKDYDLIKCISTKPSELN